MKKLKAENAELDGDRRGVWNQLRAKDKQLDVMAAEVEQARAVQIHNLVGSPSHPPPPPPPTHRALKPSSRT